MNLVEITTKDEKYKYLRLVIIQGFIYTLLQIIALFIFEFLPIDPINDYYNHINWGIDYENGLYPYRDYAYNQYPVLSVWGWIITYHLSPVKSYIWLSIIMNFPYWILAIFGGIAFYILMVDYGINDKQAVYVVGFFFFQPLNIMDTINHHGNLGISSTVIIGIYFWHRNRYFWSSAFIAAGFSLKLYPIFIAPILILSINNLQEKIKYGLYLLIWIMLFHIPVLFILPDYFRVLFAHTGTRAGLTFSRSIEFILSPLGFDSFAVILWLIAIILTTFVLIFEINMVPLEKFAIILMVNNLLEPGGGINHIVVALPIMAIYFIVETTEIREKKFFWGYIAFATYWGFDRWIFKIRYSEPELSIDRVLSFIIAFIMIISTTYLFFLYIRGQIKLNKINLRVKKLFKQRLAKTEFGEE